MDQIGKVHTYAVSEAKTRAKWECISHRNNYSSETLFLSSMKYDLNRSTFKIGYILYKIAEKDKKVPLILPFIDPFKNLKFVRKKTTITSRTFQ
jgi:hypothetical protein